LSVRAVGHAIRDELWFPLLDRLLPLPSDQTGNPWPGCICNDWRYEDGHMEACDCYGLPPDRPDADKP
jgi:hypothetical protein